MRKRRWMAEGMLLMPVSVLAEDVQGTREGEEVDEKKKLPGGELYSNVTRSTPGHNIKAVNVLKIVQVVGDQSIAKTAAMSCNHLVPILTVDGF